MKKILCAFLLLAGVNAAGQSTGEQRVTEEAASEWLVVAAPAPPARSTAAPARTTAAPARNTAPARTAPTRTSTPARSTAARTPSAPKPAAQAPAKKPAEPFKATNTKVKRFKKSN